MFQLAILFLSWILFSVNVELLEDTICSDCSNMQSLNLLSLQKHNCSFKSIRLQMECLYFCSNEILLCFTFSLSPVNCWPNENGEVNIEYELEQDNMELEDVQINIPCPYVLKDPYSFFSPFLVNLCAQLRNMHFRK